MFSVLGSPGLRCEVEVTFLESPSRFFVRKLLDRPKAIEIETFLAVFEDRLERLEDQERPTIGSCFVTRSKDEDLLYQRIQVLDLYDEPVLGLHVLAFFMDSGEKQWVNALDLRYIPGDRTKRGHFER